MKAHIGANVVTGLLHTVKGTAANVSDVLQVPELLHGEEDSLHGDAGYVGAEKRLGGHGPETQSRASAALYQRCQGSGTRSGARR